jgi:UDP-N-acetylglucosamine 2-epimerase (non-hydrolysing)
VHHVLAVYGTRPEAIKMAPLVTALRDDPRFTATVVVTGQHRDLLAPINTLFGIHPGHDLNLGQPGQSLDRLTTRALAALTPLITDLRPDAVVVQGDTTTAFSAALAARYARTPVIHLEAGLRTHDQDNPYPEELNRRLITVLAALHLAPTERNRDNLLGEGVPAETISVTGNTGIDALLTVANRPHRFDNAGLRAIESDARRRVLITTHRRENWGEPLRRIGIAIAHLAAAEPDTVFVLPLHPNPVIQHTLRPLVAGLPNVIITEPLSYPDFVHTMRTAHLILTDSGGVQEEAPALGTPVLILREATERVESLDHRTAHLVGTSTTKIIDSVRRLLHDPRAHRRMTTTHHPYGDGSATGRCLTAITQLVSAPASWRGPGGWRNRSAGIR